ncbi:hypothetical protein AZK46_03185 [Acinetobacter baumannii]|uniref:hypothetical protein n=1 Tax=Acinetobacter baumannii TaxID=470 RepID=UPI0007D742AA|nr:hypothetical protein [Acinetobacter baumannii]OAM14182.1 hypothetical protein AZK46_03185 [Acinetobacter baumannii]
MSSGVKSSGNGLADIFQAVAELSQMDVLVGIPHGEARTDGDGLTNAQLGYLHENGSPAMNMPARATLVPGVEQVQEELGDKLVKAVDAALDGNSQKMMKLLESAGMIAMNSVRAYFVNGEFAPLSLSTIRARARRGRKGAKQYLKQLETGPAEAGLVRPLIDTGELRKSVTYVIMKKEKEVKRGST